MTSNVYKTTSSLKIRTAVRDCYRLLVVYGNNSCLWNPKHPKDKDKLMRGEVLRQMTVSFDAQVEAKFSENHMVHQNQHAGKTK